MPILKSLKKLDWVTLFAELVLVFVGITAALSFDHWNAEREARLLEREILVEMVRGLQADTTDLSFNLRSSGRTRASIDTIFAHFDDGLPYHPGLADHFGRATTFTNFIRNTVAYEQLKSAGLAVISDDSLRLDIVRYYELEGELLHQVESIFLNRHFETDLSPQMIEKFSYEGFLRPAVPHDYERLRQDRRFRSSLTTKLGWLDWKDENTERVLQSAGQLLSRLREASG